MTRRHLLLMTIGCAAPIVALAAIFLFRVRISTVLLFGLFLLCPALHLWMMRDHLTHPAQAPDHSGAQTSADITDSRQTAAIRE
jgi:hypothetical protein